VLQELLSIGRVGLLLCSKRIVGHAGVSIMTLQSSAGWIIRLTKWLVDLVKKLLLEVLVLNELANTSETLGHLVRWESAHEVEHGLGHVVLVSFYHLCLLHYSSESNLQCDD